MNSTNCSSSSGFSRLNYSAGFPHLNYSSGFSRFNYSPGFSRLNSYSGFSRLNYSAGFPHLNYVQRGDQKKKERKKDQPAAALFQTIDHFHPYDKPFLKTHHQNF